MRAFFALMWTKILYISTSIVMSTIYLEEEVIVATLYIHFVSWKHFLLISPSSLFLRLSSFTEMRSVWQFFLHKKKTNSMLVRDLISPLDRLWKNESFSQNCSHICSFDIVMAAWPYLHFAQKCFSSWELETGQHVFVPSLPYYF